MIFSRSCIFRRISSFSDILSCRCVFVTPDSPSFPFTISSSDTVVCSLRLPIIGQSLHHSSFPLSRFPALFRNSSSMSDFWRRIAGSTSASLYSPFLLLPVRKASLASTTELPTDSETIAESHHAISARDDAEAADSATTAAPPPIRVVLLAHLRDCDASERNCDREAGNPRVSRNP